MKCSVSVVIVSYQYLFFSFNATLLVFSCILRYKTKENIQDDPVKLAVEARSLSYLSSTYSSLVTLANMSSRVY